MLWRVKELEGVPQEFKTMGSYCQRGGVGEAVSLLRWFYVPVTDLVRASAGGPSPLLMTGI